MKADFSGYATRAGLKCSDGRTIMPDAFKHQDGARVPLVWQHGHGDVENVLGHAILENRADGVYATCYFNSTPKAVHAKSLVQHQDINSLSIWANQLIEKAGRVIHGAIREVSLVLSGANPGALIDPVTIRHSDGEETELEDEAIIHTGLELDVVDLDDDEVEEEPDPQAKSTPVVHADADDDDATVQDVYDSMTDKQKQVLHYMLGEALESAEAEHSNLNTDTSEGNLDMTTRNVFESGGKSPAAPVITHDDMQSIAQSAAKFGSLKDALNEYALSHGIEDIDVLFPEARNITGTPEWNKRRTEWVDSFLGSTKKSPFSRIKTMWADLTHEDARAKGYVKGDLKKEEFFGVFKRVTTPTTVYKKQKLDRDDMIDITDFDVVTWLKAEMRLMLEEEIARAMLLGDGRDVSHEDKINEGNIRPIATDHELYTTTLYVNVNDANSSVQEIVDHVVLNRFKLKGTGTPNFYTTEYWIARFLLLKDSTGRRIYRTLDELASELRVNSIIAVEPMDDDPDLIGILVNPVDYNVGADKGGNVSMFDDFDIDYNQYKYLIETRISGALAKIKSALVIRKVVGTAVLVSPASPTYVPETGALTIVNTTGVVYKNGAGTVINAAGSPYTVADDATYVVNATPAAGYYFASSDDDSWTYQGPPA